MTVPVELVKFLQALGTSPRTRMPDYDGYPLRTTAKDSGRNTRLFISFRERRAGCQVRRADRPKMEGQTARIFLKFRYLAEFTCRRHTLGINLVSPELSIDSCLLWIRIATRQREASHCIQSQSLFPMPILHTVTIRVPMCVKRSIFPSVPPISSGVASYKVYRSTVSGGPYTNMGNAKYLSGTPVLDRISSLTRSG